MTKHKPNSCIFFFLSAWQCLVVLFYFFYQHGPCRCCRREIKSCIHDSATDTKLKRLVKILTHDNSNDDEDDNNVDNIDNDND